MEINGCVMMCVKFAVFDTDILFVLFHDLVGFTLDPNFYFLYVSVLGAASKIAYLLCTLI